MAAHVYVDGHEFELTDIDKMEASAGSTSLVILGKGGRVAGFVHLGPGCFVTIGEAPKAREGEWKAR